MSKISVGQVVAGSAMAAGAVMLCGSAFSGFSADGLSNLFSADTGSNIATWMGEHQAISGAAMLGGGYAMFSALKKDDQPEAQPQVEQPVEGGFAEQIAMNRALMRCRTAMAAQTPELCAGGGMGRV